MRSAQRGLPWYRILPVQVFWIPRSKLDRNVEELELDLQWTRATADASLLSATMSEIGKKRCGDRLARIAAVGGYWTLMVVAFLGSVLVLGT